jgi:glycosyltransferase involved in cell wall biosynthesis
MTKPIAIVAGYLIGNPLGGHVLSILHYLVGLKRLGYDVVFVECFEWSNRCFNPRTQTRSDDPSYGIGELCRYFRELDIGRWCYVDINGTFHGVTREEMTRICRESALLLSLWTVTWLPEFMECRKRIFIDLDPGFTQFAMLPTPSRSTPWYASPLDFHFRFSYGSRIGKPDCPIPTHGLSWLPTRPPVALELLPYRFTPNAGFFTTVMSWSARKPIVYEGVEYGQKDVEFWRIADLPTRVGPIFEIALAGDSAPRARIAAAGWRIADPREVTATIWTYRDYIAQSRGEFSVAVNLEVKSRSGWFSDRTAAYLASGKPAIVQDTGFSESLPCGEGLLAFNTPDEAIAAVNAVNRNYEGHCRAARYVAEEFFDSDKVLQGLLTRCA